MKNNFFKKPKSISQKILLVIFVFSSVFTLLATLIQVGFDYRLEISTLENNLDIAVTSYKKSIATSTWELDEPQIKAQLEGITHIPGILFAVVIDNEGIVASAGQLSQKKSIERSIELNHIDRDQISRKVGTLTVYADLSSVYSLIYQKILIIFVTQLFKTLIVSLFIYYSIQYLLTRHLIQIDHYLQTLDFTSLDKDLVLNRKRNSNDRLDELDTLVNSFNLLRRKLTASYSELSELNQELENKVQSKTELILEQHRKLEYASKMTTLGEMAGGIAHEINNPLAIISTNNQLISEILESEQNDINKFRKQILKCSVTTTKTVERITKIINGMLVLSRDSTNEGLSRSTLADIIEDVLSISSEKLKNQTVQLRVDLNSPYFNAPILCRRVQLSQVFLILISNAFDAINDLSSKWIEIKAEQSDGKIVVRVTDSGSGIPLDIQQKIFQPFFTTKEVGKGTGLGLSLAYTIIQSHKGDITVDPHAENTTFVITLPLDKTADKTNRKTESTASL